jgi:hypothetical protein
VQVPESEPRLGATSCDPQPVGQTRGPRPGHRPCHTDPLAHGPCDMAQSPVRISESRHLLLNRETHSRIMQMAHSDD